MNYNIGYLVIDESYPSSFKPYEINKIEFQDEPYNNIPSDCSLVAWNDITFSVRIGPEYYWNSVENAVVNTETGIPIYLIGNFYKK